ncbi:hypothetical protein PYW07_007906 [Mythimna separata]|uniref:Uncharacterized protein n=1 Tax=Mythimna separata TaxID=271217 RepID=A0AAD7YP85_MYTSE|nr:hypothetical protein PYW07_007906 [Mythimna separata]
MDEKPNNIEDIDVNSQEFYEKVQNEIEFDMARMKKGVEVVMNLRMEAAEIEVETAALFHAELWYDLLMANNDSHENSEDEENEESEESSQVSKIPTEAIKDNIK